MQTLTIKQFRGGYGNFAVLCEKPQIAKNP